MATADEIKVVIKSRTKAYRVFNKVYHKIDHLVTTPNSPHTEKVLETEFAELVDKFSDLEATHEELLDLHDEYEGTDKATLFQVNGKDMDDWIGDIQEKYREINGKVSIVLNDYQVKSRTAINNKMSIKVQNCSDKLRTLLQHIGAVQIPDAGIILSYKLIDVSLLENRCSQAERLITEADELLDKISCLDNFDDLYSLINPFYTEMQAQLACIKPVLIARKTSEISGKTKSTAGVFEGVHTLSSTPIRGAAVSRVSHHDPPSVSHTSDRNPYKVKGLELPTFSGNREDWPVFRTTWKDIAESTYHSEKLLAVLLKSKCFGEAKKRLKPVFPTCDGAYELMWNKLYEFYENNTATVKAIMKDFDKIKPVRDDNVRDFVNFADSIELIHAKLFQVSADTPNKVTGNQVDELKDKLPVFYKREWLRIFNELDEDTKNSPFTRFMEYVAVERSVQLRLLDPEESRNKKPVADKNTHTGSVNKDSPKTLNKKSVTINHNCFLHPGTKDHLTWKCKDWTKLTPEERRQTCRANHICFMCLFPYKKDHACKMSPHTIGKLICKSSTCKSPHRNDIICVANSQVGAVDAEEGLGGCEAEEEAASVCAVSRIKSFYAIYQIRIAYLSKQNKIQAFCDNGSDTSFIMERVAKKFNFKMVGKTKLKIHTISGGKSVMQSKLYEVPISTQTRGVFTVVAYSVPECITNPCSLLDLEKLQNIFPNMDVAVLQRSSKPVEMLLGLDAFALHPKQTIKSDGNNLDIQVGELGQCLVGSHHELHEETEFCGNMVRKICYDTSCCHQILTHSHHIFQKGSSELSDLNCSYARHDQDDIQKFIISQDIGISVSPRCGSCRCGKCSPPGEKCSFQEQQELELIQKGLSYNEEEKRWYCKYPWKVPPESLPNNRFVAEKMLLKTENMLLKDPVWCDIYKQQFTDMLNRKVCRKLTQEEIEGYSGPVYYLCHLAVLNPKSSTTPVRLCFNGSMIYKGVSLNDALFKGPDNYMNSLLGIMLRWRQYRFAFIGDISKMFNSVALHEADQHMHRFLWKDPNDLSGKIETYVLTRVNFGDTCAPTIVTEAVYSTAYRFQSINPVAADVILHSTYVDDINHSIDCSKSDCLQVMKDTNNMLDLGGFKVKQWWISGESHGRDPSMLDHLQVKVEGENTPALFKLSKSNQLQVLGSAWNPEQDVIVFEPSLNFSRKKKGVRTEDDMTESDFDDKLPKTLSRRIVLQQVMRIFDVMGLISPFVLKARLMLRQTWLLKDIGWDDVLPDHMYDQWVRFFRCLFELNQIVIPRCVKPDNAIGKPSLIIFSDGSEEAFGFSAYVRWKTTDDYHSSMLIFSKSRVGPLNRITVPQMELNGAVLASRGKRVLLEELTYDFENVSHLVDSETVLHQINNVATRFKTYEGVRIGEIQRSSENLSDWRWCPGYKNISDFTTRCKTPSELVQCREWIYGPEFLKHDDKDWPVKTISEINQKDFDLPGIKKAVRINHAQKAVPFIDYQRFSSFRKLLHVVSRLINLFRNSSTDELVHSKVQTWNPSFSMSPDVLRKAHLFIIKQVQQDLVEDLVVDEETGIMKYNRYSCLGPVKTDGGIWVVGVRIINLYESNESLPILLPKSHHVTRLLMIKAHVDALHAGRDGTLAKFRSNYYTVGASKLASSVRYKCFRCRLTDGVLQTQLMGNLPLEKLKEAPVFTFVQIDLVGPIEVAGEVQKRVKRKGYAVIFVDLAVRAVHIEFISGYSTDDFMCGLQRFVSIRSWPSVCFSDPGSQLIGADRILKESFAALDWERICQTSADHGMQWKFSPADSSHRQGLVESVVKSLKRAMKTTYHDNSQLTILQYCTLCYMIANSLNQRPLAVEGKDGDDLRVMTPNSLILGRSQNDNPGCWLEFNDRLITQCTLINDIHNRFWKKWMQVCLPALIHRKKWNTEVRNLMVGDVVLVIDDENIKNDYKLAVVSRADPSKDGKVRKVDLTVKKYKPNEPSGSPKYTGSVSVILSRAVQRLVLVVPVDEVNDFN